MQAEDVSAKRVGEGEHLRNDTIHVSRIRKIVDDDKVSGHRQARVVGMHLLAHTLNPGGGREEAMMRHQIMKTNGDS